MLSKVPVAFFACLVVSAPVSAQQTTDAPTKSKSRVYTLTLAELHYSTDNETRIGEDLSDIDSEIKRLKSQDRIDDVDYIRATVLENEDTSVMYGHMISVVTGVTQSAAGKTRQAQWRDLGSSLNVVISDDQEAVRVTFNFQNSRAAEQPDPDIGPDIRTSQYRTTLLLRLGKTTLVSANQKSCLLISVVER